MSEQANYTGLKVIQTNRQKAKQFLPIFSKNRIFQC